MSAVRLDGLAAAADIQRRTAVRAAALARQGIIPGLAVVVVGDDPASAVYVRNKIRACAEAGVRSERVALPAHATRADVHAAIARLNAAPGIHGILVQLPLPAGLDAAELLQAIDPAKDVDGLGPAHLGALATGREGFVPCTPAGILALLDMHGIPLDGRDAVVVGRSNIVGKPLALLLAGRGATVTLCHSRTRDLTSHTRRAEVLAVAAGRAGLVTADMVRRGAVVIDVGIHRGAGRALCGDVDPGVADVAGHLTPVPGGVGPMTVAMLVSNVVVAAERAPAPRSLALHSA